MKYKIVNDFKKIDPKELLNVIEKAPLGTRELDKMAESFENSQFCTFVFDSERLIGAARAISDYVTHAVIFDVVVLPEYQSKGVGKILMNDIMKKSKMPNILLYAVPGKEKFYKSLGFKMLKTGMGWFQEMSRHKEEGYV